MTPLLILLILGFCAYRITRFFIVDSLLNEKREQFHLWVINDAPGPKILRQKAFELTSCTWCFGFWVSLIVYGVYIQEYIWDWTVKNWLSAIALSGIQGFIHAIEPES